MPTSQYLSNFFKICPNQRPDAQSCFSLTLLLTVIKIAESRLFSFTCSSLRWFSFMSQRRSAFSCTPVEDSTSLLKISIFPSPKYLFSGILCTFKNCQCSNIWNPITNTSTDFAARISRFDHLGINNPALAFPIKSVDIALNGAYLTWEKYMSCGSPAFILLHWATTKDQLLTYTALRFPLEIRFSFLDFQSLYMTLIAAWTV